MEKLRDGRILQRWGAKRSAKGMHNESDCYSCRQLPLLLTEFGLFSYTPTMQQQTFQLVHDQDSSHLEHLLESAGSEWSIAWRLSAGAGERWAWGRWCSAESQTTRGNEGSDEGKEECKQPRGKQSKTVRKTKACSEKQTVKIMQHFYSFWLIFSFDSLWVTRTRPIILEPVTGTHKRCQEQWVGLRKPTRNNPIVATHKKWTHKADVVFKKWRKNPWETHKNARPHSRSP